MHYVENCDKIRAKDKENENMAVSTEIQNTITRKVFLYDIQYHFRGAENNEAFPYVLQLFTKMQEQIENLEYNNSKDNRWYGIETINITNNNEIEVVLISCKYNYKPNLINVEERTERPSPKTDMEGDKEKTHLLIKGTTIAYEQKRNGTSISIFSKFMSNVWKEIKSQYSANNTSIVLQQVIDNNFLEIIRNANKIKNVKFSVNSTLLGSDYFNFSGDNGVEDLYVIELKAKKRCAFNKPNFIQKMERLLAERENVNKVTVDIYDEDGNPRVINTDEFSKQFNIIVVKNANGEVVSRDIFDKMKDLI